MTTETKTPEIIEFIKKLRNDPPANWDDFFQLIESRLAEQAKRIAELESLLTEWKGNFSFVSNSLEARNKEALKFEEENEDLRRQLAEATAWRPIREAPKDGTAVLALLPDSDMPIVVRWDEATAMAYSPCWVVCWDGEHLASESNKPTHWLPLPLPQPAMTETEEAR